jgi:hypothetical protein
LDVVGPIDAEEEGKDLEIGSNGMIFDIVGHESIEFADIFEQLVKFHMGSLQTLDRLLALSQNLGELFVYLVAILCIQDVFGVEVGVVVSTVAKGH